MVCYMLFLHLYSLTQISSPFPDLFHFGISGTLYGCSLSITVYLALCRERMKTITDGLDSIAETIFRNELGGADFLEQLYKKNAKVMTVLTNNSLFISFITPVTFCWSVPFISWLAGKYRSRLPIPIESPYNYRVPVIYELMVVLMSSCLIIASSKKAVADCLFMSVFNAQITILKYLYVTKRYLQVGYDNDIMVDRKKLVLWIKLHQKINENIRQLIETFSPLLIIYSVGVITIVVSGASVLVMNDNNNLIQPISIGTFIAITVLYYYLLSNTAEELSTEKAQKLAFMAYNLPWYQMKKADADIVRMVILKTNRPIHVTAYCAPVFLLNRETFNAFMVTTISAFLTLSQIKDRFD
nr:uncharacterized protein LOC106688861 [Halyomorpha halys]